MKRSLASIAALVVLAGAVLSGCSSAPTVEETGETTTVEVRMVDSRYVPDSVEVPVGNRLVIELVNDDRDLHDLVFDNGVESERFGQGQSETIDVGVVSGDLDGWCSIPPHREHGMVFTVLAV
ncbi:cupredoxin domain-containing protein [Salinibacterium hongtaonis]|nr:cupredoxin domain-containing protein [Salinibacterium hongtaonis]